MCTSKHNILMISTNFLVVLKSGTVLRMNKLNLRNIYKYSCEFYCTSIVNLHYLARYVYIYIYIYNIYIYIYIYIYISDYQQPNIVANNLMKSC